MGKKLDKLKREVKELRRAVKPVRSAGVRAKAKPTDAVSKKPLKISDDILFLSASRDKARVDDIAQRIYAAAQPMPGVVPAGHDINQAGIKLACDAAADSIGQQIIFAGGWGGSFGGYGAFAEGQAFLGYPYLAELAQRPEYRVMAEVPAMEMFRKGITFKTSEAAVTIKPPAPKIPMIGAAPPPPPQKVADPKAAKLKELEKEFERLRVLENLQEVVEQDAFFGRSHLYLDFDDAYANADELLTSVGDGQNYTTGAKVTKGSFKRLACVEAMWCYPSAYNSNNPLAPDWYKPQQWFAMGKRLDASRLLTFVGREVPDILKPAYAFGGLAMSQMAKPYVDNWLRTRQSTSDLLRAFTVWHLSTDLSAMMQEGGAETLGRRLAIFNNFRDNKGVFLTNKDTEEFANVSAQLGTLDKLQAQAQEQMCTVAKIPKVKLLGLDPAGLNASSEGEIETFDDTIISHRKKLVNPKLDVIFRFAQINLWGEVDPDISYEWPPLDEMNEKEKADIRKIDADTDLVLIDGGVIDASESRSRIAKDKDSPYSDLDPSKLVVPPQEMMPNMGKPNQGGGIGGGENPFAEAAE